jgi:hypothetical protein
MKRVSKPQERDFISTEAIFRYVERACSHTRDESQHFRGAIGRPGEGALSEVFQENVTMEA